MEQLMVSLSQIVTIIAENFWFLLLVVAFLCSKENRLAGLLLIAVNTAFGYNKWVFIAIVFMTLLTHYLHPRLYYKKKYENEYNLKLEEIQKKSRFINLNED